jgi:anaerobic selenocysteine-containing dehydrogenase
MSPDDPSAGPGATRTTFRTCPLCEATCGLEITIEDGRVRRIRGDREDVFSHGFICPKGSTLKQLHDDPDRLRAPVARRGVDADGAPVFEAVGWDEAFRIVDQKLGAVRDEHGKEAVAIYLGNPMAHVLAGATHTRQLIRAIGSKSRYSASTVDQIPRQVASSWLYGSACVPVPDLDRTDLLVIIGANPYASNGSLCTAPDFPGRIEAIQARGGKVVVVDPRVSRTAETADQHIAVRPGTDAALLAAVVHVILDEGLGSMGPATSLVSGLDALRPLLDRFGPDDIARFTGVAADVTRRLARDIAGAPRAAVYGRIGTNTVEFGTLTSWLFDVVAIVTGNLDRAGGSMFSRTATERMRGDDPVGRGFRTGRWRSRVNDRPEVMGEYPAADLPTEILTPGDGRLRMLFTVGGNPVNSCPDSERMDEALDSLEAMVSVDVYINETTRHADVILPPPSSLEKSHYDVALYQFGVRNVANWSAPAFESEGPTEEEILARLTLIALGAGPDADSSLLGAEVERGLLSDEAECEHSPVAGRDVDELLDLVDGDTPSDRMLDILLRTGPYGDGFGSDPDGLSLARLRDHPHGIDLGPLEPRLPALLGTPSGTIELFAGPFAEELERLAGRLGEDPPELVLVGRRQLRSNNSWMHNLEVLVKGRPRCTLHVHPDDATRLGVRDGGRARVRSRVGELIAPVEVSDTMRPGVVSLPHGWGHDRPGIRMAVAERHAGVNSNILTDPSRIDPLSGNAVLNGIPVEIAAV